jgi:crotonobetainyl-CoA:carnitine CoA-transferase CaiB-like acyl-CoA transferase
MPALDGITVVALEHAVAAPLATRHLADLGARVIKVERPEVGDFARHYDTSVHGQASYFVWLNRGKESIELDLKDPDDRTVLDRMVASADVLVQNLAPGAAARLGLDAAALREAHPRLVHCSITGYGDSGPSADRKAYDLLVQCEAGLVEANGSPEQPAKVGVSVVDIATGTQAYAGILAALYERERTGKGATLSVAMIDAIAEWMVQPAYLSAYGDRPFARSGLRHASIAPYGPFRTADSTVFLGIQNEREWARFCQEVLDRPELAVDLRFATNVDRVEHVDELTVLIEDCFAGRTAEQVVAQLDDAQIACALVRTPRDLLDHPQLAARGRWQPVDTPGGPVAGLLPPVVVAGSPAVMGEVPALGAHNDALRREFGPRRGERERAARADR